MSTAQETGLPPMSEEDRAKFINNTAQLIQNALAAGRMLHMMARNSGMGNLEIALGMQLATVYILGDDPVLAAAYNGLLEPLYKIARGKSEQYLKDERALEDYLISTGVEEAVLKLASGEERAGEDLQKLVEEARNIRNTLNGLHSRYNRQVIEQAAILGVLNSAIFGDPEKAKAAAPFIAKRMNVLAEETERGWEGTFTEDAGFVFTRTVRGVQSVAIIDHALLGSADARKLDEYAVSLQKVYEKPGALRRKDETWPIHGPVALFEAITGAGRKGISMQRYKGLGEMNPEQLWETTLDVNARSLLQVRIKEVDEANVLFDQLMGDLVEPRRQFIQDNALSASVDV